MQVQHITSKIEPVEAELASVRCEIQTQHQEHQKLLGIKTHLEQEIHLYQQLLEEGEHLVYVEMLKVPSLNYNAEYKHPLCVLNTDNNHLLFLGV